SDNDWVRITSNDGFSFIVRRKTAKASGTMKSMLDTSSSYAEATTKTCPSGQRAIIAEKLVEYMNFKTYYETVWPKEDIPIQELMERFPREIVLELLLAADYQESKNSKPNGINSNDSQLPQV
ncbi:Elongin-C, partial [Leucoagaricus sp. SymC.cos]